MCYKKDPLNDGYMGSSKLLKLDYKIYGKENFIKVILNDQYQNTKDMLDGETNYILECKTLAPNGYNRILPNRFPNFYMAGSHHSEETKQQIKEKMTGKNHPFWGKSRSKETREKIGKSNLGKTLGRKLPEEMKEKISKSNLGKILGPMSEEHKDKIRRGNLGVKRSKKTREKITGQNNPFYGKHHSEESKNKMRRRKLEYINKNNKYEWIHDAQP